MSQWSFQSMWIFFHFIVDNRGRLLQFFFLPHSQMMHDALLYKFFVVVYKIWSNPMPIFSISFSRKCFFFLSEKQKCTIYLLNTWFSLFYKFSSTFPVNISPLNMCLLSEWNFRRHRGIKLLWANNANLNVFNHAVVWMHWHVHTISRSLALIIPIK